MTANKEEIGAWGTGSIEDMQHIVKTLKMGENSLDADEGNHPSIPRRLLRDAAISRGIMPDDAVLRGFRPFSDHAPSVELAKMAGIDKHLGSSFADRVGQTSIAPDSEDLDSKGVSPTKS